MNLKVLAKLVLLVVIAFILHNILSSLLTHVSLEAASHLKILPSSNTISWVINGLITSIDEYVTALLVGLIIPWLFRQSFQMSAIIVAAVYLIGYQLYYNLSVQITDKRIIMTNGINIGLVLLLLAIGYLLSNKLLSKKG